nr:guanine nucleotide-binding protein G(s) subunit alpha isoforms XLas-like [Aegilops tauschii subsp. strangulata]
MAPKKRSRASAHPSTSKAPPPAASNAAGDAGAHKDVNAAGDVVGAGGAITTSPAADARAGDIGGEQHQQRLDVHAPQGASEGVTPFAPPPPTDGHSCSNDAWSGASHRPPAAPTMGATAVNAPPPGRANQATALDGAADPEAPPLRNPAAQVVVPQQCGRGTTAAAAGTVRSQAIVRSTSSTPIPSTTTEAMARAQLLLRFSPAAEQMDEWRATIQSLLGFAEAGGSQ